MTETMMAPRESIHPVDPRDHVVTALRDLVAGEPLDLYGETITARADIPKGHKIAIQPAKTGEDVLKYGWPIGRATVDIAVGDHVHVHNVATRLEGVEGYSFAPTAAEPHAEAPRLGRHDVDAHVVEVDAAVRQREQSRDAVERRRLAASRRAQQRDELPARDGEGQAVERGDRTPVGVREPAGHPLEAEFLEIVLHARPGFPRGCGS